MKKLMTVMAAAATALFAIGAVNGDDQPLNATSFEALNAGDPLDVEKTDAGEVGDTYWAMDTIPINDNGTVVSNEAANASSRPDCFESASKKNTLHLDTSTALYRTVKPNATTNDAAGKVCWKDQTGEAIGEGIYLDTLVKFTAADDVFGDDALAAGDKIAISYVEQSDEVDAPITNFVIRAGYIGENEITAKNYEAKLVLPNDAEFDKDIWHRLTVRTIQSIDAATGGNVGFVVYVDKVPLVYAKANETIGDNVTLAGVAATLGNSVFPSAVASGGNGGTTITAASFSGTGAIDDVVFTKVMPQFIAASSKIPVTFTIPSGVTSVDVTIGDAQPVSVTAANPTVELEAGTTEFTLAVNIEQGSGYTFSGITGATMGANNVVTVDGAAMEITINVSRNNFIYIDADDAQQSAVTFTEALAGVKAGGMIKLAYDYDVSAWGETLSDSAPVYTVAKSMVLDLNGKTLNGGSSSVRALFSTGEDVVLTVIDSVQGDSGKIVYGGSYGIFAGAGDTYLGSNELTDYGPVIDGAIVGENGWVQEVVRGKFSAADNTGTWDPEAAEGAGAITDPNGFVSELFLAQGSSSALVAGYWVVSTQGGDEPEGYDNGGDGTFVIAAATETALKAKLPAGKTLADKVSASSDLTYAQAYALGLWDAEAEEVAELEATISVGADGKVTVTLANEPADGYLVTCKVYEKASLTAEWPSTPTATYAYGSEQAFTPGSATAGFYKVAVVISNSDQQ